MTKSYFIKYAHLIKIIAVNDRMDWINISKKRKDLNEYRLMIILKIKSWCLTKIDFLFISLSNNEIEISTNKVNETMIGTI